MSMEPVQQSPESCTEKRRFRFSLKTVFVLLTLVAIWLGYRQYQQQLQFRRIRYADELAQTIHDAQLTISLNLKNPPLETTIVSPNRFGFVGKDAVIGGADSPAENLEWIRSSLIDMQRTQRHIRLGLVLDVREALSVTTALGLRKRLLAHYESGLQENGFVRVFGRDGTSDYDNPELWSLWALKSQNPSMSIYIRVRLENDDATEATAEIVMIGQATLD